MDWLNADIRALLSPVVSSAVTWIVAAGLAGVVKIVHGLRDHFKEIEKNTDVTQEAVKALMRSDLIKRYKECRDHGNYMKDIRKDEWLNDYEIYHTLRGANGYLDSIHDKVLVMNTPRPEDFTKGEGTD